MTHDWIADSIAALALLVVAWPLIEALAKPAALEINIQQYCTLQHYCGHPQLFAFIDIQNIGARPTTIRSIDLILRLDQKRWNLEAKTYAAQDFVARLGALLGERREMLVGSITLSPNEHWRELVDAYNYPSHADEKSLSELVSTMDEQVAERRALLADPNSKELVEVDAALVSQAETYFEHHYGLYAGNYTLSAIVSFDEGKKVSRRDYSFTLWDRPAKELRDVAANYKYGIAFAHSKPASFSVRLSPERDSSA
jgi:hypothetical protein